MQVQVVRWRADEKNTRKGWADLKIVDVGLTIHGCAVHRLQGDDGPRTWVAMPSKPYDGKNGEKKWWPHAQFDKENNAEFQRAAITALKAHITGAGQTAAPKPAPAKAGRDFDDDIPF